VLIEFGNPVKVPPEFAKKGRLLSKIEESILILVKGNKDEAPKKYPWQVA
jgi:hypothetical protein